jgi:hypothetical protein
MRKQLTSEQIENLFEFCEMHHVCYYDVQIELVDHMASAIEELWNTNPDLPFEEAVYIVGEQFGVEPFSYPAYQSLLPPISGKQVEGFSGFDAIVEAKEKELRRKYDQLQLKYIREFFRLPKIILTITVTLILFFILKFSDNDLLICGIIQGLYLLFIIIYLVVLFPRKYKLEIQSGKSFLLYEHFKSARSSLFSFALCSPAYFYYLFGKLIHFKTEVPILNYLNFQFIIAFLITLFGITAVAIGIYTPQRIKEDFTREYPQFVKS